jgi:hypothetical protein
MTFGVVFAAVLAANLLTVMFVWAGFHVSKRERNLEGPGFYIGAFLMPLVFCAGSLMIALDKVPDWLNAALR